MPFSWNPLNAFRRPSSYNTKKPDGGYDSDADAASSRNQNFKIFNSVNTDIEKIVSSRSVVTKEMGRQQMFANPHWETLFTDGMLAMPIATGKSERINQYRSIANFPECNWCLDEICDDFLHEDENGNVIVLKLPDKKANINETRKDILQTEFTKFMNVFKLRDDGYNLIKRFLIEGELCWENIIKQEHPELGIIGARLLPSEYYETLADLKTSRPIGIIFDVRKLAEDTRLFMMNSYTSTSKIFNTISPAAAAYTVDLKTSIPFLWSQLTYINSDETSYDGMTSYPLIEKSKQAYQQLALMQDSAVILRVTRAPERLLFNVSTGKMTQHYADEYVRNFAIGLKSKKTAMPDGKDIIGVYNPVSMLESYIFGKSDGNDGTTVESVGSSADYEQIADIEFFLRRFMKQFKVPWSRYKTPENTMEKNDTISYEEYSFSRMIVRFQRRFALGFKKSFVTHLKLRGLWDKYQLNDADINISLVKPVLYDLYQTQKLVDTKMATYKSAVENEEFSKSLAMKKYLGMSEAEVEANYMALAKDAQMVKLAEFWADKINEVGPGGKFALSPVPMKIEDGAPAPEGGEAGAEGETAGGTEEENKPEEANAEEEKPAKAEPPAPTFGLS
jgi:hypothetical protein